jgi:hypothetical protein
MTDFSTDADAMRTPLDRDAIAALAYRLWQQRGCPQDSGEQDWLQAEAMLRAESLRQAEATLQEYAAAPFADEPPVRKKRRTAKPPQADAAPPVSDAPGASKARVTRARPARPDA